VSKEATKSKALVLRAFDTLFDKRDYVATERFGRDNSMDSLDDPQR
jgi:hypothetical protein